MHRAAVGLVAIAAGLGCKHIDLRPGLLLPIGAPSRDPRPTRNPVQASAGRREAEADPCAAVPSPVGYRAEALVATLATLLAGGIPLVELFIRFDETAPFRPPDRPVASRSRARDRRPEDPLPSW